jgi:hypothetical protein
MVLCSWMVVGSFLTWKRFDSLKASRSGEDFESFYKSFESANIPRWVLRCVYENLERYLEHHFEPVPIRPDDLLEYPFGLTEEILDDVISDILDETGRQWPENASHKVETVRDLVYLVADAPMNDSEIKENTLRHALNYI